MRHAKTGIERHERKEKRKEAHVREKEREGEAKREKKRGEFHVHPCRASRFRRLRRRRWHSRGLCTRARSASISVPTPSFLCASLSPFPAFPSDISSPSSLLVLRLPGCRLPSSVTPASARLCLACRLRHHQRPAITFLKKIRPFARKSVSTSEPAYF